MARFLDNARSTPILVKAALPAIVLLAAFLRFYQLGSESIWFDEGYSIRVAAMPFTEMFKTIISRDLNPPLYTPLLHFWLTLFGNGEAAARSLSAVFGVLAVLAMFLLARRLFNDEAAYAASFFVAVSQFAIYYSQEARGYSLMLLLSILSFYFFVDLLDRRDTHYKRTIARYSIASILLAYTHIYGALVVIAQALYFIINKLRKPDSMALSWKTWLIAQGLILAAAIPWAYMLLGKIDEVTGQARTELWPIQLPTAAIVRDTFVTFSGNSFLLILFGALILILAADILERSSMSRKSNSVDKKAVAQQVETIETICVIPEYRFGMLLSWLLVPIVFGIIASYAIAPIYLNKYLIGALPAFLLLAAAGFATIEQKPIKLGLLGLVAIMSFMEASMYYNSTGKEQWREVVKKIDQEAARGAFVITNIDTSFQNCFDYYSNRNDLKKVKLKHNVNNINAQSIELFKNKIQGKDSAWVIIYAMPKDIASANGKLEQSLEPGYKAAYHATYHYLDVYRFERLKSQTASNK